MSAGGLELGAGRQRVLACARAWRGTPFVKQGDVLGVGVDCAMLLLRTFQAAGIVPADLPDPRPYPDGWFLRRDDTRYAASMLEHGRRLEPGERLLPADVALFQSGRAAAHGTIVTAWPRVIHARPGDDDNPGEVVEEDSTTGEFFNEHPFRGGWRAHVLELEDQADGR